MISRQSGIGPGRDAKLRPLYRAVIILSLCLTVRAQNEVCLTTRNILSSELVVERSFPFLLLLLSLRTSLAR
jgi:hypothetical protein